MSGVVKLDADRSWVVAGWAYDSVLEMTQKYLDEEPGSALAEAIRTGTGAYLSYITLERLSPAARRRFRHAVCLALADAEREGPGSFHSPEFYPGFIARFRELVELLAEEDKEECTGSAERRL